MQITTQQQLVDFLVQQGKPANLAQACVTEMFHFADDSLLQRYDNDHEFNGDHYTVVNINGDNVPTISLSEEQAIFWYDDFMSYNVEVKANYIEFDGEATYDLNGRYLSTNEQGQKLDSNGNVIEQ